MPELTHRPTKIKMHTQSRTLELVYSDQSSNAISYELLRVYSPSAEVKGHGVGNEKLQVGKQDVEISKIEPVGNYAIKICFDDGHDSGIYDWNYLFDMGQNQKEKWNDYLDRLQKAGFIR